MMNVLAVGLTVMTAYLALMALWLRYDRRLDEHGPTTAPGGERE